MRCDTALRSAISPLTSSLQRNLSAKSLSGRGENAGTGTALCHLRPWLLALLYRVVHDLSRRAARLRRAPTESLEGPVPPEPIYGDDEEFWEWYQPDEMTRWEDVVEARTMTPEEEAETDEELTRTLDPRARGVFLLCELHRVPLTEAAVALGIPLEEAAGLLEEARHNLGVDRDTNMM
jgi:DNA-directed RNA polymerase specialized sigma24 family protein